MMAAVTAETRMKAMPAKNTKKCLDDGTIKAALAAQKPWADIVRELHVGPGRISRVARGATARVGSKGGSNSGSDSGALVMGLKAKLSFMNEFFKANATYLFANDGIAAFIENHPEFDEVDRSCQA